MVKEAHGGMEKDRSGTENLNYKSTIDGGGANTDDKEISPIVGKKTRHTYHILMSVLHRRCLKPLPMKLSCVES
jgi:hypothetical protein